MRADDEAEFRSFAASNMRALRRTAFLLCGDWHHADDVVQNVLTKLAATRSAAESQAEQAVAARHSASTKTAQPPRCSDVGSGETACVADISKGGFRSIDVQLFRTASPDTIVDVTATAPEPTTADPSPEIPLDQNELIAIAQAVAAHF